MAKRQTVLITKFRVVVDAYLECSLWAIDEEGRPPHSCTIESKSIAAARRDCADFIRDAGELLAGLDLSSVGLDIWLTRNRYGAGFWDRGYGARGEALTKIAYGLGLSDAYIGDDGVVYLT